MKHLRIIAAILAVFAVTSAEAAELTLTRPSGTFSTLRSLGGNATAVATEVATSPTDPTDIKTYVDALAQAASLTPDQLAALGRIPSANPPGNKVWKTDSGGTPAWRNDETGSGGGTTQQLSGNWGSGGASLNLQLTPGNSIELTTPNELKRGGGSSQTPTVSVKTGQYVMTAADEGDIIVMNSANDTAVLLPEITGSVGVGWSTTVANIRGVAIGIHTDESDEFIVSTYGQGGTLTLDGSSAVKLTVISDTLWQAVAADIKPNYVDNITSSFLLDQIKSDHDAADRGKPIIIDSLSGLNLAVGEFPDPGISQTAADGRYLALSGGTMTGALALSGAPTSDLHAATKKYVDDNAGGGGSSSGSSKWEIVELGSLTLVGFSEDAATRSTTRTSFGNIASFTGASQILSYNDLHGKIFTVAMPSRGGYLDLADLGTVNTPEKRSAINGSTFFFCNTASTGAAAITIGGIGSVFPAGSTIEPQGCVEIFLFAAPTTTAFADSKFFNLIVSPHDEIEPRARYRSSTSAPAANFGNDGDIVLQRQSASETRLYEKVSGTWHLRQTITSGGGGSTTLSDATPQKPNDNAGAAGTASAASRGDHKHPQPDHATRTSGGLMSSGDKQQVDKIADLEHRTADLSVTAHDDWNDLPNGNAAAFRMVGVNQASTLNSSAWGHRHQALLTNTNYVVALRIPRADSLAQYRLTVDDVLVAPSVWSEGDPDATYRYFGGVGTISVARNKYVEMQKSTRTYHTTFSGDVPAPTRNNAPATKLYVDSNPGGGALRLAQSNHEALADMVKTAVFSWALATDHEGGMALSSDAGLDAAGAAALTYSNTLNYIPGTSPEYLYVRRDNDLGDAAGDFRVYSTNDQRPTLGTNLFPVLGTEGDWVYHSFAIGISNLVPTGTAAGATVPLRFEYHGTTRHTRFDGGLGGTATQEVARAARDRYTDAEKTKLASIPSPNVLLAWDADRATNSQQLPSNYADYKEVYIVVNKNNFFGDQTIPVAAFAASFRNWGQKTGLLVKYEQDTRTISVEDNNSGLSLMELR